MAYNATVYNIMIASPGDVLQERSIARDIINSWNNINSESKKIILLPIGWETHSAPQMGKRAQEVINQQVTDKGDLLIGIFWTRIGTKTGDYESGTIEEIEKHIAAEKPVMLYFSDAPVRLESVNPEQYERLQNFKRLCLLKGLVETYSSIEEFREKLSTQLTITVNTNLYFKTILSSTENEVKFIQESDNIFERLNNEISEEAKKVILGCAKTESSILLLRFIGDSFVVQTDQAYEGKGQREYAKWEAIFKELEINDLIKNNYITNGESYDLTNKGYEFADFLENK